MTLDVGSRIAHYDVTAKIGEGGMGEVYRARDTKLDRDVALKVLPEAFTSDPDRLARFEREAKVLASLHHPNIGSIHGLEESEGIKALVLELVEGPTLEDRLKRGPIPVDEALPIAKQIAEALEAAHESGVIHRDLKPANIKVREDGTVKVLDFGLAKAVDTARQGDPNQSPTLTAAATRVGVIMGTAAYMSPEQARGKPIDKRADIWALGVVLFEMLTGTAPFAANSTSETLAAVLQGEPEWSLLPDALSSTLVSYVRRSLAKDARERVRDVGDVRLALDGAFDSSPSLATVATRPAGLGRMLAPALAAFLVFGAGVWVATLGQRSADIGSLPSTTLSLLPPDGSRFALRQAPAVSRTVSGSSSWRVTRMDLDGHLVRTLCPAPNGRGGAWGSDDVIIFKRGSDAPLFRVAATGGSPTVHSELDTTSGERAHKWPEFLPNSRRYLYFVDSEAQARRGIYLASLDEPQGRLLTNAFSSGDVAGADVLVRVVGRTLIRQSFDADTGTLDGESVPIVDYVGYDKDAQRGLFSVSGNGVLVYSGGGTAAVTQLTWFDRNGRVQGTVGEPDVYSSPQLAPDGRSVAVERFDRRTGTTDIWGLDTDRGTGQPLVASPADEMFPIWSPDSGSIVFGRRDGVYRKTIPSAGGIESEVTSGSREFWFLMGWVPGSQSIAYATNRRSDSVDVLRIPLAEPIGLLTGPYDERQAHVSPDGRWVAFISDESDRFEVYVAPVDNPAAKVLVSRNGGFQPRWAGGGDELFFLNTDGVLMTVPILPESDPILGRPVPLFRTRLDATSVLNVRNEYDVSLDGQRVLVNAPVRLARQFGLTVVLGWTQ